MMKVKISGLKDQFKNNKKCQKDSKSVEFINKEYEIFEVFGSDMGFKDKENNWHSIEIYDFDVVEWKKLKKFEEIPMIFYIMRKYFKDKETNINFKNIEKLKELKDLSLDDKVVIFKNINSFLSSM